MADGSLRHKPVARSRATIDLRHRTVACWQNAGGTTWRTDPSVPVILPIRANRYLFPCRAMNLTVRNISTQQIAYHLRGSAATSRAALLTANELRLLPSAPGTSCSPRYYRRRTPALLHWAVPAGVSRVTEHLT